MLKASGVEAVKKALQAPDPHHVQRFTADATRIETARAIEGFFFMGPENAAIRVDLGVGKSSFIARGNRPVHPKPASEG